MKSNKNHTVWVGDRLIRTKGGIFSKHHAIYYGKDYNGVDLVAENQNGHGVRIITLQQFLNAGELLDVKNYYFPLEKQQSIIQKVDKKVGTSYNLWSYNCEHFVNDVLFENPISYQIENIKKIARNIILPILIFMILASISRKGKNRI